MAQNLVALAGLISSAARDIDSICKEKKVEFPELNDAFNPKSEEIQNDPQVLKAAAVLAAAAEQIIAASWPPAALLFQATLGFHVSSAIRVAAACNVSEALREAGPNGANVIDICQGLAVPAQKLARVLRLLATRHIFREVKPDVFCNNRLSSLLDTGKPLAVLRAEPEKKHQNTPGLVALLEHFTDEQFKMSAYLTEVLTSPTTAVSDAPEETAFNLAYKTDLDYWSWLELAANKAKLERFGIAMSSTRQLAPDEAILEGFGWAALPKSATVVDVGGGVGSVSLVLAKAFPEMKIVVQDRGKTIKEAQKFWDEKLPAAVSSGRVVLEEHDFFTEQPRQSPNVFLMRMILHDWADSYAHKILKQLRDAAGPGTTLVLVENLVPYACRDDSETSTTIPGAETPPAPELLLANMGVVSLHAYLADILMLNSLNGQERTLAQFEALLTSAGWKIERVNRSPGALLVQLVAKPA